MKISTKGRYAMRLLIDLYENQGDGFVALKDIAARQDISKKYLEQIVPALTGDGILKTSRGFQGGYRLARAATDISLIEIVEAMEGPLAITECSHDQSQCGIAQQCGVRSNWRLINDVLAEALRGVTLAQMLHPLPHSDRRRISVAVVP